MTSFRINFLSGTVLTAILIISQLLTLPIFLEKLGPQLYGVWVLLSVVILVGRLGDFGLGDAVIRHVALAVDRSAEDISSYAVSGGIFVVGLGLLAAMLIILGRGLIVSMLAIPADLREIARSILVMLAGIIPLFLLGTVARGVIAGLQRLYLANGVGILAILAQVGVSITLIYGGYGIWSLLFGVLSFHLIMLIGCSLACWLVAKVSIWEISYFSLSHVRDLLGIGSKLTIARSMSLTVEPVITMTVSRFLGADQVAFFEIARRAVFYLRRLIAAGLNAILPRVSYLDGDGAQGLEAVRAINAKFTVRIFWFGVPIVLILMFGADTLFFLWLGDAYDARITVAFRVMLLPYFLNVLVIPHYMTLIAWGEAGRVILVTITQLICLAIVIGLNWLLDFSLGLAGLVIAYGASLAGASVSAWFFYRVRVVQRISAVSADDPAVLGV